MKRAVRLWGTIGPSVDSAEAIIGLIEEGMQGIRLNMSHSRLVDSGLYLENIQSAQRLSGRKLDVLIDLKGSELRMGDFIPTHIGEMQEVRLADDPAKGLPVPAAVIEAARPDMRVLLSDGEIELIVLEKRGDVLFCCAMTGGRLLPRKSVSLPDAAMDLPPLTEEDIQDLRSCADYGIHHVMLPFVHGKKEIDVLRAQMEALGLSDMHIFAKIEDSHGAMNAREIALHCDEVVIARGDLGANVPPWDLPVWQQRIAKDCRAEEKRFMVVTHMLESMVMHAVPTRAEMNDIAHAVWDGAASVMLTAETAMGAYPLRAMAYLRRAVEAALEYGDA